MTGLSEPQERAVRLALALGRERVRAKRAEATIAAVRRLAERWQAGGNPAAAELLQTLEKSHPYDDER